MANNDLQIYYDSLIGDDFIDCKCSRWDVANHDVVIETWLTQSQLTTLRNNTVLGAIGELSISTIGMSYYDNTWEDKNTLKLLPNPSHESTLKNMREETIIYVKNITTSPIEGTSGFINVKIEGKTPGQGII